MIDRTTGTPSRERELDVGLPAVVLAADEGGHALQPVEHRVAVAVEPLGGHAGRPVGLQPGGQRLQQDVTFPRRQAQHRP
jgi:hypothetical protein